MPFCTTINLDSINFDSFYSIRIYFKFFSSISCYREKEREEFRVGSAEINRISRFQKKCVIHVHNLYIYSNIERE